MAKKNERMKKEESVEKETETKCAWNRMKENEIKAVMEFSEKYKAFLNEVKTERECVEFFIDIAKKNGFKNLEDVNKIQAGDKVYLIHRDKILALAVIGKRKITDGINFVVAHIDSPRIDLKPSPLFEDKDSSLCVLKTQYYGGIKKYQWLSRPLQLRGIVCKKTGEKIKIRIGGEDNTSLIIPDLLPHLAKKVQGDRKAFDAVEGEEMLAVFGSIPLKNDKEPSIRKNILKILKEKYNIDEEDFLSADLSLVPADRAMDVGIDRSMVGGYGQDDRVCAYTAVNAILEISNNDRTAVVILYDREETGSDGDTGAKSTFLEYFIMTIMKKLDAKSADYQSFLECMRNSRAISADVDAVVDPAFKQVHDLSNAAKIGHGVIITKYTGSGGKYGTSEAHAEYLAMIRRIFDEANVIYQIGTLGKVDYGGGGTIAKFMAEYGMNVVDVGPGVLGMHGPYEIVSKIDIYNAYLAYKAFLNSS